MFLTVPGQDPRNPERVSTLLEGYAGRAVLLSARAVEFHPDGALARVEAAAAGHTILRPTWFVQNFTEGFLQPDDGIVTAPTGDGREPFVDLEDVADVAVAALTRPGQAGIVELSGPEAITFAEAAERVGARFVAADPRDYAAGLDLPTEYVAWRMAMFDAILQAATRGSAEASRTCSAGPRKRSTRRLEEAGRLRRGDAEGEALLEVEVDELGVVVVVADREVLAGLEQEVAAAQGHDDRAAARRAPRRSGRRGGSS